MFTKKVVILLFIGVFFLFQQVFATDTFVIKGKVTGANGDPASNVSIALMEISMSDRPSIKLIQTIQTNSDGSYAISVDSPKERTFFRITSRQQGQSIGSEPARFKPGESTLIIDLRFPKVINNIELIDFTKQVLIFESLNETIRITELISFFNKSDDLIDAKRIPFKRPIPESAVNTGVIEKQDGIDISFSRGEMELSFIVPPGAHQIFFSYEIPVTGSHLNFIGYTFPNTNEIEIATLTGGLGIRFDMKNAGIGHRLVEEKKNVGGQIYHSTTKTLKEGDTIVPIYIDLPFSKKRLVYPAMGLFIMLMSGLVIYLKKKPTLQT